jgi:predicted Zn-dependent peptidase
MGFHAFGRNDERRYALKLLSVVLGENMSSRLFQKLRERHGFCYSVNTCMVTLADTGALHVSAGLDPKNLERALKMILRELASICQKGPSRRELRKAQDYTIGQTFMGLESTSNQIMWMGENLLSYGEILDPEEIERKILSVTPEEIQQVACCCLNRAKLGVALVGPLEDTKAITKMLANER